MVAQNSQEGWIRACLAGQPGETLDFHPFFNEFSIRAKADTKAATVFVAKDSLAALYDYAFKSPNSIIAGILAARVDLLLSQCYSGVSSNFAACLNNIPDIQPTPAQTVYRQLWQHTLNAGFADDKSTAGIQVISHQMCCEITQLLPKPRKLADYLHRLILNSEQDVDPSKQSLPAIADSEESEAVESDNDAAEPITTEPASSRHQQEMPVASLNYPIFSRQYDQTLSATSLTPQLNYGLLREKIIRQLPQFDRLSRRLANKLRRELLSWQKHTWLDDLEEGYLHSARLASLIASPVSVRPFRQETQHPLPATAVTLLIDCSGSMRGEPLLMAAAWVDALVEALELCRINTEVLGFTTGHWDKGPVAQQWQAQGGKPFSGRLNNLLHVEFKRFDQPWRRARHQLAAILQPQWQKENIDGEALDWACQRLEGRTEPRKLLFVLSDAQPYDQLTSQNNGCDFLEKDLLRRINAIEQKGRVELIGIGLGHRVCRVYSHSVQLKKLSELPQIMLRTLLQKLRKTVAKETR